MTTDITRLSVEATVSGDTKTQVSGLSVEAVVAPFPQKTSIGSIPVEALVSKTFKTFISNLSVEAVVAPAPVVVPIEPTDIGVSVLNIISEVVVSDKYLPLTGEFNPEETIPGWIYDKRRVENWLDTATRYNTFLGGHNVGLLDGTALTDWQSGIVTGIDYLGLSKLNIQDTDTWIPKVSTGNYSLHWEPHTLYSDKSVSENFSEVAENGLQYLVLDSDVRPESIEVALWKRTSKAYLMKVWDFKHVETFTGEISAGARLETEDDDGNFIVGNLASRKKEFVVRDNTVYLNSTYLKNVGWDPELTDLNAVPEATVKDLWENKYEASGEGRYVYSKYFPLLPGSVRLATLNAGVWTEFEEVDSLSLSTASDLHFSVDHDLGIIKTSGFKGKELVLKTALSDTDTEINVYEGGLESYPEQGVLIIGSEQIFYYEKGKNQFANLLRGYNSTIVASHAIGSKVENVRQGLSSQGTIYISYVAVPKVTYEVSDYSERLANATGYLNVKNLNNFDSKGIVQIKASEKTLNKIVLTTDKPRIKSNLYGPMSYGFDVARLTATAFDVNNDTVEEMPLWIEIISGTGLLNSNSRVQHGITNTRGEMYAYYNSAFNQEDIESHVSALNVDSGDTTLNVSSISPDASLQDVWTFQIMKDDPVLGSVGVLLEVLDADPSTPPWGDAVIKLNGLLSEDYIGGIFLCTGTDSIIYRRKIQTLFHSLDSDDMPITEITLDSIFDPTVFVGENCRLFKFDEVEWVPALKNGVRRILYKFSNEAVHPLTGVAGAYTPIHPSSLTSSSITFTDLVLPAFDPTGPDTNLGGYIVIAPSIVEIQAFGRDPLTGRIISSNIIKMQVKLNNSLIGVRNNDTLPIPIGWTLLNEEHNVGSGLGGANFITVNPKATNINQLCIMGNI
jgi:hypothetical protein